MVGFDLRLLSVDLQYFPLLLFAYGNPSMFILPFLWTLTIALRGFLKFLGKYNCFFKDCVRCSERVSLEDYSLFLSCSFRNDFGDLLSFLEHDLHLLYLPILLKTEVFNQAVGLLVVNLLFSLFVLLLSNLGFFSAQFVFQFLKLFLQFLLSVQTNLLNHPQSLFCLLNRVFSWSQLALYCVVAPSSVPYSNMGQLLRIVRVTHVSTVPIARLVWSSVIASQLWSRFQLLLQVELSE